MKKKYLDEILNVEFMKISSSSSKVQARATVEFETFTLGGFKVIKDDEKTYATPPSYPSGTGWRVLFTTKLAEDWNRIKRKILDEYNLWLMKEAADGLNNM